MRSGTTPKLIITLNDITLANIEEMWITFATMTGTEILTKNWDDCTIVNNKVECSLTQAETISLNPSGLKENKVQFQVRVLMNNDQAFASQIQTITVEGTLKDGEIE